MDINKLRSLIREAIKDYFLNENYTIEPIKDKPFFSQSGFKYKIFNIIEGKKNLGKVEAQIPISSGNEEDKGDNTATITIKFNPRLLLDNNKHSKIVNDIMPDLVEEVEDDIVANKFIYDIEVKGLRGASEKVKTEELFQMGEIKILSTLSIPEGIKFIIGEPGVSSDEKERYTDEFGRVQYRNKSQSKGRHQRKPLTQLRTRKK